jgi:hypothetical protein
MALDRHTAQDLARLEGHHETYEVFDRDKSSLAELLYLADTIPRYVQKAKSALEQARHERHHSPARESPTVPLFAMRAAATAGMLVGPTATGCRQAKL